MAIVALCTSGAGPLSVKTAAALAPPVYSVYPTDVYLALSGAPPYAGVMNTVVQGGDGATIADYFMAAQDAGVRPSVPQMLYQLDGLGTGESSAFIADGYGALAIDTGTVFASVIPYTVLGIAVYQTLHFAWDYFGVGSFGGTVTLPYWAWSHVATTGAGLYVDGVVPSPAPVLDYFHYAGTGLEDTPASGSSCTDTSCYGVTCAVGFPADCQKQLDVASTEWAAISGSPVGDFAPYDPQPTNPCGGSAFPCTVYERSINPDRLANQVYLHALLTADSTVITGTPGATFHPCQSPWVGDCYGAADVVSSSTKLQTVLNTAIQNNLANGVQQTVPNCSGMSFLQCVNTLRGVGFKGWIVPVPDDGVAPGTVGTSLGDGVVSQPAAGAQVSTAAAIAVRVGVDSSTPLPQSSPDATVSTATTTTTPLPVTDTTTGPSCSCPPLDFSPLNVGMTAKFPFGLFNYVSGFFDQFATTAEAPSFTLPDPTGGGSHTVSFANSAYVTSYRPIVNTVMKLLVVVGSIFFAGTWLFHWGRGSTLDGGDE